MTIYYAYEEGYIFTEVIFGSNIVYESFLILKICADFQELCYLAELKCIWNRKGSIVRAFKKHFNLELTKSEAICFSLERKVEQYIVHAW